MKLHYSHRSIFESSCQTIVNPVNCIGVMGKGLALEYKNRYPEMFSKYRGWCKTAQPKPGDLQLYKADDYWILNFATKNDWRDPSSLEYIERGMKKLVDFAQEKKLISISFPKLGCGVLTGQLEWVEVKHVMEKYINKMQVRKAVIHV